MSSTTGPIPPQNGRQRSAERAVGSERLVDWVDFRLLAGAPRHRGQTRSLAQEYVQVSNLGTANCRHGPRPEEAGHGHDISALNESKSKYQRDRYGVCSLRAHMSEREIPHTCHGASRLSRNHRWRVQRQRVHRERNKRMFRTRTGPRAFAGAVAALASVVIAGLAAAPPSGATGAPSPVSPLLPLAHQSTAALARPLAERAPGSPLPTVPVGSIDTAPAAPGLDPLQASAFDVVVSWHNHADNATSFTVYRLGTAGNWQDLYQVAKYGAGTGEVYSWTDTNTVLSGQCYMVAAVNASGASDSPVECTVRPDGGQFPVGPFPTAPNSGTA